MTTTTTTPNNPTPVVDIADYPFELLCSRCATPILYMNKEMKHGELLMPKHFIYPDGCKPVHGEFFRRCSCCGQPPQFTTQHTVQRKLGEYRVAIPCDSWKKKLFRKRLKEANYEFTVVGELTPGVTLITVLTGDLAELYSVVLRTDAEAQATQHTKH